VASIDIADDEGQAVVRAASEGQPGRAAYYHCDITQRKEVEPVFEQAIGEMGGLDVLANIAGAQIGGRAEDTADEDWDTLLAVNVLGTMLTNQVALRALKAHGGRIINVGSDAGLAGIGGVGFAGMPAYGASKGAVIAWTRNVAHEWGKYDVTVNSLIPSIWTPMYDGYRSTLSAEELSAHDAAVAQTIPLGGRLGDFTRDLAPVMIFLAGEGSRFITGQLICANGGLGMSR
jgi:NAD(P)-dependent dehydrogenase (short-subunit alcohol dehydrogenase family)